jgi:hypothetical protein
LPAQHVHLPDVPSTFTIHSMSVDD